VPIPFITPDSCPHDRRPGTTVCLHCRHAALQSIRHRRWRALLQSVVGLLVVAGLIGGAGVVSLGLKGYRQARDARNPAPRRTLAIAQQGEVATPAKTAISSAVMLRQTPVPIVGLGESMITDSVKAIRTDTSVTVFFDLPMIRTRRADKFERFVRATLPAIFGAKLDSLLAEIPAGTIARQGDLLTELPSRGARLALSNGWNLTLWPETRPGQDGPLVVRYRVAAR
jgi:hypothetical protein